MKAEVTYLLNMKTWSAFRKCKRRRDGDLHKLIHLATYGDPVGLSIFQIQSFVDIADVHLSKKLILGGGILYGKDAGELRRRDTGSIISGGNERENFPDLDT